MVGFRGVRRIEGGLLLRRRRRGGIAIAELLRGGPGVLRHDAGLVLDIGSGLEGLVDGRDGSEIGHRVGRAGAIQRGQDRGRVAQGLVDEQVGDGAQAGVEDERVRVVARVVVGRRRHRRRGARAVRIERRAVRGPVHRIHQRRELLIRRTPRLVKQVVVRAIDRTQTPADVVRGHQAARSEQRLPRSVRLRDLDLRKDELEVCLIDSD